jgi:predicted DCC family thiol-disulfide oxidoreductase YuxK
MAETVSIVYDGNCGFCRRSLLALRRLDARGAMVLYDSHDSETVAAKFPMLAGADFDNAMFAVTSDGRVFRGYFAFKQLLRKLPLAWPLLPVFYLPGVDRIGPSAYAWVARNRRRLGCESEVCELPAPPPRGTRRSQ